MELRRARAPLALIALLAVGAWTGSSLAQGATRARSALTAGLPTVSVPGVSVPVAGVTVTTPAVGVPVPPVTATVPPVTATVPPVTVSTPVVGVTTPTVTVATPPVRVTTPSPTVSVPAVHVTAPLPVPGTVSKPVAAVVKPVAAAVKPVAATVNATTTAVTAATKAATLATGTAVAKTVKTAKTALKPVAATTSKTAAKTKSSTTRTASSRNATSTSTSTSRTASATATRTARLRAARVRAARLRAARLRAARARHARLVRAARQRRRAARALRLAQVQQPPQVPVTPPLSPDPALPVLNGAEPYQLTDPAATPTSTSIDALLLPISTAAAAAPLVGVTVRSSSTLRATAPPQRPFPPSGGFNGASRFTMFLLGETSVVLTPAPTPSRAAGPVTARTPVLTPVAGGRSQAIAGGGTRGGMSIETPLGRITISRHGYVFGSAHYPLVSVRGVATTVLISLAALAAVAALLALGGAAGRRLRGGGRLGSGSRRHARGTRGDLYAAARRKQIPGRSRMSKEELKRALDDR